MQPFDRESRSFLQQLVSLRVRQHGHEPAGAYVEQRIGDSRRDHRYRHFHQDRFSVRDSRQFVHERLDQLRREVDLGPDRDLEQDASVTQSFIQLSNQPVDSTPRVVVYAVDQMGRRDRKRDTLGRDAPAKLDRLVPGPRAVVDPGQQVRVDVDHATPWSPVGARRRRRGFTRICGS